MPFTTPKTWSVGDVLPASDLNTYNRDNISWLATDKPHARVRNSTNFSHNSSGNNLSITFDAERVDVGPMHDTSSNTDRLTVPTGGGGFYLITGSVEWDTSTAGTVRILSIELNGHNGAGTFLSRQSSSPLNTLRQSVSALYQLAAGDYVCLTAFQDSGGTRTINATGNTSPEFSCIWQST